MKMEIEVELVDAPGQLSFVLDQISRYGGNIVSIIHLREQARGNYVPVRIIFEVKEEDALELIQSLKFKVRITQIEREVLATRTAFILIGHVFQKNILEITDAVFRSKAQILEARAKFKGEEHPSQVYFEVTADADDALHAALRAVAEMAVRKELTMITSLEVP